ncbi:DMT family transporter [Altericroceibacterium xinjiangense]|uniref:DMT family transporter n=1 Tax=Altericroceibacterium xinjiangense TaxID=762261 RepID=UPI000F7DD567|nr:DMT family transporter [Altericroceibacterium xinjiangense]
MSLDRSHLRAHALLGLVMLLWSGNSIVARAVRFDVPPFTLAFGRWTGALIVLLPFAAGTVWRERDAILKAWKPILLLGLLGIAAFNGFLYSGLQYTTATKTLLLEAAIPPMVLLFDRMLFRQRANWQQWLGVTFSVVGVGIIVFEGDPAKALRLHFGKGDVLVLASVVVWALYTVYLRLKPKIAPMSFIAVTFMIGAVAMAPLAAMEWMSGQTVRWNAQVVGAFAYVALLPSLLSYFIYNAATEQIGPARAGQAITLMPLFGALLSSLLLDEPLFAYHFAGMALILVGIVTGAFSARESAGAADAPPLEQRP